jgi:virulence-associated protein VagC
MEMKKSVIRKIAEEAIRSDEGVLGKLFMNGGSQAIRIPAEMRFAGEQVRISYNKEFEAVVITKITREELKQQFIRELREASDAEKAELSKLKYVKRYREPRLHPAIEKLLEESD